MAKNSILSNITLSRKDRNLLYQKKKRKDRNLEYFTQDLDIN